MRRHQRDAYDDDDDVIQDGQAVRVKMMLMDGKMREVVTVINANDHRPHYGTPTELESFRRQTARQVMIDRAENAWRTAGFRDQQEPDDPPDDDEDDVTPYDAYKKRLSSAWKTNIGAGPGSAAPGPGTYGAGPMDGSRSIRSARDSQTVRDTAYQQYCDRLTNAWRNP